MEVYKRYASQEHEPLLGTFEAKQRSHSEPQGVPMSLTLAHAKLLERPINEWLQILPHAVYFEGKDPILGHLIIVVYENPSTGKTCTASMCNIGTAVYEDLILDARSRFWSACENLLPIYQKSNVRRALAVSILKHYSRVTQKIKSGVDETTAGSVASSMNLIQEQRPADLGYRLLEAGLIQTHRISSVVVDIVYDNTSADIRPETFDENNSLVFLLGQQLEQLFDPLLEYSPEKLDNYHPKITSETNKDSDLVKSIVDELITVSTNFTMKLVSLLQDFIVPLRVNTLRTGGYITRINRIFPPTIDEVTRINCILLDSLVRAQKISASEVLRAAGTILPHFYKPFIRHEANLKQFHHRLNKFHNKNKEVFSNPDINCGGYTTNEIESIVCGVLLQLSKFKLILGRLYQALEPYDFDKSLAQSYQLAVSAADAYGEPQKQEVTNNGRVFTPSGKILTEIASNWPVELQYGWLVRKVVGIYELRKIGGSLEVIVIFSDILLFIELDSSEEKFQSALSVSDILMHAMANEKPLPKGLPNMQVSSWYGINDVVLSAYSGPNNQYLKLLPLQDGNSRSYQVVSNIQATTIIELVNKARILNKHKPFHLFKTQGPLCVFSTAHEIKAYEEETSRSSFAMLLNLPANKSKEIFSKNKHLFTIWGISFLTEHQIHVEIYLRDEGLQASEIVERDNLREYICTSIAKYLSIYSSFDNEAMKGQIKNSLSYEIESFVRFADKKQNEVENIRTLTNTLSRKDTRRTIQTIPEVYLNKYKDNEAVKEPQVTRKRSVGQPNSIENIQESPRKKRKGFFRRLFSVFSSKDKEKRKKTSISTAQATTQIKRQPTKRDMTKESMVIKEFIEPPHLGLQGPPSSNLLDSITRNNSELVPQIQHAFQPSPIITNKLMSTKVESPEVNAERVETPLPVDTLEDDGYTEYKVEKDEADHDVTAIPFSITQSTINQSHSNSYIEENVRALNSQISHSYRSKLNKYVDPNFANNALYTDGERNWVPVIARENSSLLGNEIQALKADANMDTEDVIDVSSTTSLEYTDEVIECKVAKQVSICSVGSSVILENFKKDIDNKFHAMKVIDERQETDTNNSMSVPSKSPSVKMTEIATRWRPNKQTRDESLMEIKRKEKEEAMEEQNSNTQTQEQYQEIPTEPNFGDGPERYTENKTNKVQVNQACNTDALRDATPTSIEQIKTDTSEGESNLSDVTVTDDVVDSKVKEQLPQSISYLSDLLEGKLRFDYEVNVQNEKDISPEVTPHSMTPIAESPSLAYLGSFIHSGHTIRKHLDKYIKQP